MTPASGPRSTTPTHAPADVASRCRGVFPGQVAERGGELIDNLHKTMIGYASRFGLTLEDVNKVPGEVFYFFDGQRWPEVVVVDQFREFVAAMRPDLRDLSEVRPRSLIRRTTSGSISTSLLAYLDGRNATRLVAGPVVKEAIVQAYVAEYGLAADRAELSQFPAVHSCRPTVEVHAVRRVQRRALARRRRQRSHRRMA